MTWFNLVKSSEMKEFEMLAEKYAEPTDMWHLDYIRKKHGRRSPEFYESLNKQVTELLKDKNEWFTLQDITKGIISMNPNLSDSESNLEHFLRKRLEKMDVITKQEPGVGRTGKKTYYKVSI